MATTISRTTLVNDTGTPTAPNGDGTVLNNTFFQDAIYSAIDNLFTNAFTFGSTVSSAGFGSHTFSGGGSGGNVLFVRNTSAGTANYASLTLGNDATTTAGALSTLSTAFVTAFYNVQDSTVLHGSRPGGLSIAALDAVGAIRFYSASAERMRIHASGAVSIGDSTDAGTAGLLRVYSTAGTTPHYFYGTGTGYIEVAILNQTAGAGNFASLGVGNDLGMVSHIYQFSSTWTTTAYHVQNSMGVHAGASGGMSVIASHASGAIRFYTGGSGTENLKVGSDGLLYERGRSIPMGAWQDVPYNGTNFSADGGGTWTVQLGDQYAFRYCIVGDMMHIQFSLVATTHTSAGNQLFVLVPGGYTVVDYSVGVGFFSYPSGDTCLLYALASTNAISIQHWPVTAWGSSSTNGQSIHGTIAVKVNV